MSARSRGHVNADVSAVFKEIATAGAWWTWDVHKSNAVQIVGQNWLPSLLV